MLQFFCIYLACSQTSAIKLANNRTPKLIGLKIYEINSIGTNNSPKAKVVLAGKKIENICTLDSNEIMNS